VTTRRFLILASVIVVVAAVLLVLGAALGSAALDVAGALLLIRLFALRERWFAENSPGLWALQLVGVVALASVAFLIERYA